MKNHYKFWIVLSFLVVFAAGVFSGLMLDRYIIDGKQEVSKSRRDRDRRPPRRFPTVDDLAEELALTDAQREDLRLVFDASEQRIHELNSEVHDMYRELRHRFLDDIKSLLNPEQVELFDAMLERFAARHREDMEKRKQKTKESEQKKENLK